MTIETSFIPASYAHYWIFVGFLGFFVLVGLAYDVLFGRDRMWVYGRKWAYRNLHIPPIADEEFGNDQFFETHGVPCDYAIAKRFEFADRYLDYPPEFLHPDMVWEEIPLASSPWMKDLEGLYEYVQDGFGESPDKFFNGRTVAEIIADMYSVESRVNWSTATLHPGGWYSERKEMKRKIRRGVIPNEYLERKSIADVIVELYRLRHVPTPT